MKNRLYRILILLLASFSSVITFSAFTSCTSTTATKPEIVSVVSFAITPTTAKISWTLNVPATGQIEFGPTTEYGQMGKKEASFIHTSHEQTLKGLTPGMLYHYRVHSLNQAGAKAVSDDFTFTTLPDLTLTPGATTPAIVSVVSYAITQTTAKVSWTLNVPATGQIEFGPTTEYGQMGKKEASFINTSHEQMLKGLTPGTLYHYRVHSLNQAGAETVSGDFTFRTLSVE
ncbi:MAG: fibronectin type III domain-containing protein [Prolixibacteraceae bacterium]|jgi:hypothetical protein|nr:fibronectin type III domain-containing protein [Prolixibacteraceae bacterium]